MFPTLLHKILFYYFCFLLFPSGFFPHFYYCTFEDCPLFLVWHIKVCLKPVPPSLPFGGFQPLWQPPLRVLQTTDLQALCTEAAAGLEVRDMSRSLSLTCFLTWHFHISNLNSIICSLLCWVRKVIALTQAICILEGVRMKNVLLPR